MKIVSFFNRAITFCFYLLFFFVPLTFAGNTSELFELNKMWLTWGVTILIMLLWISKMSLQKRLSVQRTPLDIPLLLFLLSQIIATIFSLDQYVSFWGYYSRFNGGLLSTITYLLLYYAFVSNVDKKYIIRMLQVSLLSGLFVSLWGLPSHFGYDPTCYVFRGALDVSCWTDAFQPKVRIFSTLGQPDWMAAYLGILIPIALAFGIRHARAIRNKPKEKTKHIMLTGYYIVLTSLFYLDLIFTRARSGFIAVWVSLVVFFLLYLWMQKTVLKQSLRLASYFLLPIFIITFFAGTPISQLDKFTFAGIQQHFAKPVVTKTQKTPPPAAPQPITGELGGTDSGKIRLYVWKGALEAWMHYPLFGTGVETFAFAYYKFRPAGHNMTSEWEYLYNKAHNEYLNYLATTGTFGLGTYLAIIFVFFFIAWKKLPRYNPEQYKHQDQLAAAKELIFWYRIIVLALAASFVSILVSNFFGFSVVIINIYLFLIPAFVFSRENLLKPGNMLLIPKDMASDQTTTITAWQYIVITVGIVIGGWMSIMLLRYWIADTSYAYGYNLDHAGYYQQANAYLAAAVQTKPEEATFSDELATNDVVLASALAQKDATTAAQLAQQAIQLSNQDITNHPNNVVYWKTRVRIFYTLAQLNAQYATQALEAIQKASALAPTDAKIWYNLGLLYAQTGNLDQGIQTMQRVTQLKADYQDAYYALGLFYRRKAIDKNGTIIDKDAEQKAVSSMHFILDHFDAHNKDALKSLKDWGEV